MQAAPFPLLEIGCRTVAGEFRGQHLGEINQHARGRAPDITILIWQHEEIAGRALPFAAAALQIAGINDEIERHLENLGDLEWIWTQRIGNANKGDHWDDLETGSGDICIEASDDIDVARRQADL